ncbi:hypothetical protein CEXT_37841 [Caerostris extrusa]|uniref:Uncharacterized protein n=1 Tax=Caerostris extrusa TaxID=172846 RepID=A0AAV4XEK9_CAEEX|nr:hypothetical protein CEXT_37841 [Caerostris extrusa]
MLTLEVPHLIPEWLTVLRWGRINSGLRIPSDLILFLESVRRQIEGHAHLVEEWNGSHIILQGVLQRMGCPDNEKPSFLKFELH